jgi:hypothetical protein
MSWGPTRRVLLPPRLIGLRYCVAVMIPRKAGGSQQRLTSALMDLAFGQIDERCD